MDVGLLGVRELTGLGWLASTVAVGLVAVLLAGVVTRRLPLRRGRWLVAALGLLVFTAGAPTCVTSPSTGAALRTACAATTGSITFVADDAAAAGRVRSLALGVALAVGIAPVVLPVLRLRARREGE